MHSYPTQASIDLVKSVTRQDLAGLTRDEFIGRVEGLLRDQEEFDAAGAPGPDANGVITVTLKNVGMGAAVLRAVLETEKTLRLN